MVYNEDVLEVLKRLPENSVDIEDECHIVGSILT